MRLHLLLTILLFTGISRVDGNNLVLEKARITSEGKVSFQVSWDNSWKLDQVSPPGNHDAVWIFLKIRDYGGRWKHLRVSAVDSVHQVSGTPRMVVDATSDGSGLMMYRHGLGSGHIRNISITLKLADNLPSGAFDLRIFGIEMVHVSEGPYYLGDSASNFSFGIGNDRHPYLVEDENTIATGGVSLSSREDYFPADDIPAEYPKGYDGFYIMKYEISQEQYKDFLNTLTATQQTARVDAAVDAVPGTYVFSGGASARNGIAIDQPSVNGMPAVYACNAFDGDALNSGRDGQGRACNFLSWSDLAAYLDWAALRPMTEFEYEKACRGPMRPVRNEFSWGTDLVIDANNVIMDGTPNERVTDSIPPGHGLASHGYRGPAGPLRAGFAARPGTGRPEAGASYFGAMELSGNLWEICVNVSERGLIFKGRHGDGFLDENGNADVTYWPMPDGAGAGFRGGGWNSGVIDGFRDLAVSDRFYIFLVPSWRRSTAGGRGIRKMN